MAILNIGIVAHVDAGKTSLTERILYETGVIKAIGSVDKGTTRTDTLELERARGITIKSAVVSFQLNDLQVNLIDTPGHADFVAEVERSLGVLDGVVLVISAVEGVQPQTRRLMRALQVARLPTVILINKIDRLGARGLPLLDDIRGKLNQRVVAMNAPATLGDRGAAIVSFDHGCPAWRDRLVDLLSELDEEVIAELERTNGNLSASYLKNALKTHVAAGSVSPVFFGSAITGVGVAELLRGVSEWLPPARDATHEPLTATIFKIARQPSGEKIIYARIATGKLAVRQHVTLSRRNAFGEHETTEERVTGIDRFLSEGGVPTDHARAGEIIGLHGLRSGRIGDCLGLESASAPNAASAFPAPALESVVRPIDSTLITPLRTALEQLAEQDPLISLRQRNQEGEISVRLYGEVQKEVIQETLAHDYGIDVDFGPSHTICVERPIGNGEYTELIATADNPFYATVGIRVEPGEIGSGIQYVRELGSLPLAFYRAIEETVYETLTQGLSGWAVSDCFITLTQVGFYSPVSTAGDFRNLTPLVVMRALHTAGTEVYEPIEELDVEFPEETFGAVCGALIQARATIRDTIATGSSCRIMCDVPTAELRGLEQQLPGLTHGEGGWESRFSGYAKVTTEIPTRKRIGPNPLNRAHYLAEVAQH